MSKAAGSTLRRRMLIQTGLMVISSLVLAVLAAVQVNGLHADFGQAVGGYQQLRQVYEAGLRITLARDALADAAVPTSKAADLLRAAAIKLDAPPEDSQNPGPANWVLPARQAACSATLRQTIARLAPSAPPGTRDDAISSINAILADIAGLSADARRHILAAQRAADLKRARTLTLIVIYGCLLTVLTAAIGLWQYRSVMRPLKRLGQGTRDFAAGQFGVRVEPAGDREFAALAADFNHMAGELESLYRELEQKVQTKSRELAQSERLASVGYLAAGVAHEINNPLGIISGYAERSLRLLDQPEDPATPGRLREAATIICDEAFRCKDITTRLLSLARPGRSDLAPVPLVEVVEEVVAGLRGLPDYAGRNIALTAGAPSDLIVTARGGEMKQITLNLLLNALDAADPQTGHVQLKLSRTGETVELSVEDDGRGMTPETLGRIFEPFYSGGAGQRGTGLGLSITHAIVREHGGSIRAESAGPGKGSRLVVTLPAANKGVAGAAKASRQNKVTEIAPTLRS